MGTMNTELKTKSILTRTVKTVMKMMMAATRTVDDDNGGNTNQDNGVHSKNKWGSEGPLKVLQFVPNTGPYLVLRGTPVEGASKDPHAMVL